MGRKVYVDLVDAVGTFMAKTNLMSSYMGDLDDLLPTFDSNNADSNLVDAINHLSDQFDSISNKLFGGGGVLRVTGFVGDSASFKRLRVGELTADSATIDSATIRNATITGKLYADSAHFKRITVDSIGVDPGATLVIDSAEVNKMNVTSLIIDSADIVRLKAQYADIDSADIDSATIDNLTVTTMTFDSQELTDLKLLTIKDQSGVIVLSGYLVSTSSTPNVA